MYIVVDSCIDLMFRVVGIMAILTALLNLWYILCHLLCASDSWNSSKSRLSPPVLPSPLNPL